MPIPLFPGSTVPPFDRRKPAMRVRAERGSVFEYPSNPNNPLLIAGANFGVGSSREHSAWALADLGTAISIAPDCSDIFMGNAVGNGIPCLALPLGAIGLLTEVPRAAHEGPVHLDLDTTRSRRGSRIGLLFRANAFRRHCRRSGSEGISLPLVAGDEISACKPAGAISKELAHDND